MNIKSKILSVKDIAELFKLDPQTVSRKAQKGEIPGFKIGNRWRFNLSDIEKWLDEKKVNSLSSKLSFFFKKRKEVCLVYLFGSQATKTSNKMSDIDIAILLKENDVNISNYKSTIISQLMKLLGTNNIDVVILNSSTPLMNYEVLRDGELIYVRNSFNLLDYKLSKLREYYDTEYFRNIEYDYFLEAVNQ